MIDDAVLVTRFACCPSAWSLPCSSWMLISLTLAKRQVSASFSVYIMDGVSIAWPWLLCSYVQIAVLIHWNPHRTRPDTKLYQIQCWFFLDPKWFSKNFHRGHASMRECGIPTFFSLVPLFLTTMGGTGPPCHSMTKLVAANLCLICLDLSISIMSGVTVFTSV